MTNSGERSTTIEIIVEESGAPAKNRIEINLVTLGVVRSAMQKGKINRNSA